MSPDQESRSIMVHAIKRKTNPKLEFRSFNRDRIMQFLTQSIDHTASASMYRPYQLILLILLTVVSKSGSPCHMKQNGGKRITVSHWIFELQINNKQPTQSLSFPIII